MALMPAAAASATSLKPGSEISGVPASLTKAVGGQILQAMKKHCKC
jgi:hypothetical protein